MKIISRYTFFLIVCLSSFVGFSQTKVDSHSVFDRLTAIAYDNKMMYSIDGNSVMSQEYQRDYVPKQLKKVFRKQKIKKNDVRTKNQQLKLNHVLVIKNSDSIGNFKFKNYCYFVENVQGKITFIVFASIAKPDFEMQSEVVSAIINDSIPRENIFSFDASKINFVGREVTLHNSCQWMNINSVQCPYNGQINWSIHKNLASAQLANDVQLAITKSNKDVQMFYNETVDIVFEGVKTKAKKKKFKIKGLKTIMLSKDTKYLEVYYVATKVRGKYVNCVLSFWNNDNIDPKTGLPPLLSEVMSL